MSATTVKVMIAVVGLAIIVAAGYLIHHLTTGQMGKCGTAKVTWTQPVSVNPQTL